jgi:hypothetical protein
VSSEGVQRDLLPIIEGCVVSTKHGNVSTCPPARLPSARLAVGCVQALASI